MTIKKGSFCFFISNFNDGKHRNSTSTEELLSKDLLFLVQRRLIFRLVTWKGVDTSNIFIQLKSGETNT